MFDKLNIEETLKEDVLPMFSLAVGTVALSFLVRKATKASTGINTLSGAGALKSTIAITVGGVASKKLMDLIPKTK